jgi:hypothetical protein
VSLVVCINCGAQNADPGGALDNYRCGRCGQMTLMRPAKGAPDTTGQAVVGAVLGGAVGAVFLGPVGAATGAALGAYVGAKARP